MLEDFSKLSMEEWLNRVAARTPTPGGGSVAAATGAMGCALARMVVAYAIPADQQPNSKLQWLSDHLSRADQLLRALMTHDAEAYKRLRDARRNAPGPATPAGVYEDALMTAAAIPLEVAALAAQVLQALDESKELLSSRLASDLGIAALLLSAAVQAGRYTSKINAASLRSPETRTRVLGEIQMVAQHARTHADSLAAFVEQCLIG